MEQRGRRQQLMWPCTVNVNPVYSHGTRPSQSSRINVHQTLASVAAAHSTTHLHQRYNLQVPSIIPARTAGRGLLLSPSPSFPSISRCMYRTDGATGGQLPQPGRSFETSSRSIDDQQEQVQHSTSSRAAAVAAAAATAAADR